MIAVRLRHVHRFRDRHGRTRFYLRRKGRKLVPLKGEPGTPEFMASYQAALDASEPAGPAKRREPPGSLGALAEAWYGSRAYRGLLPSTQAGYRRIVERLRRGHGAKPVALLDPVGVRLLLDEVCDTPAVANHRLRLLRMLLAFAVERGWRDDDPTAGVKRMRYKEKGFPDWGEGEIAAYEARWPLGTRERLALALLLHTAQRRSDVVRMGWQHVTAAGRIRVRQQKTGRELLIPIHPELREALEAVPPGQLTFLQTMQGKASKPFTGNGFYNRFVEWAREAGVSKGLSPHGLRKAAARRLAEAGCSSREIMAVTGHETLSEVERYTRAVDQAALSGAAMARVGKAKG